MLCLVREELAFSLNSDPERGVSNGALESHPETCETLEGTRGVKFACVMVHTSLLWRLRVLGLSGGLRESNQSTQGVFSGSFIWVAVGFQRG